MTEYTVFVNVSFRLDATDEHDANDKAMGWIENGLRPLVSADAVREVVQVADIPTEVSKDVD